VTRYTHYVCKQHQQDILYTVEIKIYCIPPNPLSKRKQIYGWEIDDRRIDLMMFKDNVGVAHKYEYTELRQVTFVFCFTCWMVGWKYRITKYLQSNYHHNRASRGRNRTLVEVHYILLLRSFERCLRSVRGRWDWSRAVSRDHWIEYR